MFENKTLMSEIAANYTSHSRETDWYKSFSLRIDIEVKNDHTLSNNEPVELGEIGELVFPFYSMGEVNSSNLFGLDELILFSYYFQNRGRYQRVLDLGANIGLHTLVLLSLGYDVESYEPDPVHISQIKKVLSANNFSNSGIVEAAVSNANGTSEFVRVIGNTTGSHLLGAKNATPYGGHESFPVTIVDFNEILDDGYDLVKMDVEGHEATLIDHLAARYSQNTDFILEVGSTDNASSIFSKVNELGLTMFSQKNNWQQVQKESDVPTSYKEGSLLITSAAEMTWVS